MEVQSQGSGRVGDRGSGQKVLKEEAGAAGSNSAEATLCRSLTPASPLHSSLSSAHVEAAQPSAVTKDRTPPFPGPEARAASGCSFTWRGQWT